MKIVLITLGLIVVIIAGIIILGFLIGLGIMIYWDIKEDQK